MYNGLFCNICLMVWCFLFFFSLTVILLGKRELIAFHILCLLTYLSFWLTRVRVSLPLGPKGRYMVC